MSLPPAALDTRGSYGEGDGRGSPPQDESSPSQSPQSPHSPSNKRKSGHKSERDKRTYRACLHCRQRKSRYSSGQPGCPPCERCIREQHECILGGSRRGGRRVKKPKTEEETQPITSSVGNNNSLVQPVPIPPLRTAYPGPSNADPRPMSWSAMDRESRVLPPLPQEPPVHVSTPIAKLNVDDHVASHDLQNPADALEFLAHVAERDSTSNQLPPMHGYGRSQRPSRTQSILLETPRGSEHQGSGDVINYPPLMKGYVSFDMIETLLGRYEDKYHQFFPLANPAVFDPDHLSAIAAREPHLLAAILTVASKDEKEWWQVHDACSSHMQMLISDLVYTGRGSVEAVEALLILAEWVPRRPSSTPAVGRGEEDQAAWMYVGTAIRLGYLLGIDRTGFSVDSEPASADLNRKRLAWSACYMSDRQISVRIGKAFWSRGPGPMTALRAENFPSLQARNGLRDDFAAIFQANLELTQLFSNAHDVLYATKSRSQQLNFGGEYVKYIDDFRVALRSWHSSWGIFSCSPPLKASLILSYEYLRLYVNAFAYQATLNRLVAAQMQAASSQQQQHQHHNDSSNNSNNPNSNNNNTNKNPFGADIAATPDARFIYDSIDAAKSLLSTFNSFVDPAETFRFMPLRYYLYVIYSACFLYKARATGVMAGDSRGSIKRMITDTIDRLQKASACANDVGDRYSRLIRLLWRKPPSHPAAAEEMMRRNTLQGGRRSTSGVAGGVGGGPGENGGPAANGNGGIGPVPMASSNEMPGNGNGDQMTDHQQSLYDVSAAQQMGGLAAAPPSINTFSWLDLPAMGEFAVTNNVESLGGISDRGMLHDRFDDSSNDGFGGGGFENVNLMMVPPYPPWNAGGDGGVGDPGVIF